ncbi:hypothetical protein H632_c3505p0, partial [Helicosporidium sp. ATCC 50920]
MGVHVSFVRSSTLDSWTEEQLQVMAAGGNARARSFFKQHGWDTDDRDKTSSMYESQAARQYRQLLAQEANDALTGAPAP